MDGVDHLIHDLKDNFEEFQVGNRDFKNRMKRSIIMFQQNAGEMLKRAHLNQTSENDTYEVMVKLWDKRCNELNDSVKKARSNYVKLNKRMKKFKLTIMKNSKLTDEISLLFDSNKSVLGQQLNHTQSLLAQLKSSKGEEFEKHADNMERTAAQLTNWLNALHDLETTLIEDVDQTSSSNCCTIL